MGLDEVAHCMTIEELEEKLDEKTPESETLWRMFARGAQIYSTPLFSLKRTREGDVLRLAGSGTLVAHDGSHYILTAAHVWYEVLKYSDFVGVTLREVYDHTCLLETATILAYGPERPAGWTEWGPDLILLRIPDIRVGEIKAFKVFYDMRAELSGLVTRDRNETYLLVGTPSVLGSYTQNHASVELMGMWVGVPRVYSHGQWDYFDTKAALRPPSSANTFGGVSGGGLWRVQVYYSPESGRIESAVALEGVAFYELGTENGQGIVRSHGLQSIDKTLATIQNS
jgi:hypothetical protein